MDTVNSTLNQTLKNNYALNQTASNFPTQTMNLNLNTTQYKNSQSIFKMAKKSHQHASAYNSPSVFSQKVLTNPKRFKAIQSSGYGQIRENSKESVKNNLTG